MSRNWKPRPYMPLFWDDYDSDTRHLSTEEHGAYFLLIMAYWQTQKPLPADDQALASITRLSMYKWKRSSKTLRSFFKETSDGLYHKRIHAELLVAMEKSQKAKEKAEKRWCNGTDARIEGGGLYPIKRVIH